MISFSCSIRLSYNKLLLRKGKKTSVLRVHMLIFGDSRIHSRSRLSLTRELTHAHSPRTWWAINGHPFNKFCYRYKLSRVTLSRIILKQSRAKDQGICHHPRSFLWQSRSVAASRQCIIEIALLGDSFVRFSLRDSGWVFLFAFFNHSDYV